MGIFLVMAGFAVNAVCGVVILVKAFRVSVGWGLAVMFLPFAALFFVLNHWSDTKAPFLGGLGGAALMILGIIAMPASEPAVDAEERRTASRATSGDDDEEPAPKANYASAAAPPASTDPAPSSSYPPASYTPGYAPTAPPPAPVVTDPQPSDDDWRPKPKYEQVYVDRQTGEFYAESCKKRPESTYRIPRSVALMQGMTEAKCR